MEKMILSLLTSMGFDPETMKAQCASAYKEFQDMKHKIDVLYAATQPLEQPTGGEHDAGK